MTTIGNVAVTVTDMTSTVKQTDEIKILWFVIDDTPFEMIKSVVFLLRKVPI